MLQLRAPYLTQRRLSELQTMPPENEKKNISQTARIFYACISAHSRTCAFRTQGGPKNDTLLVGLFEFSPLLDALYLQFLFKLTHMLFSLTDVLRLSM